MKRCFMSVALALLILSATAPVRAKDNSGKIFKMREAIINLQNKGNLEIREFHFCGEIRSFGSYSPLGEPVIKKGETLLSYFEPGNYFTEKKDGLYRIHLVQDLTIVDSEGKETLLEKKEIATLEHTSKVPVLDIYFKNTATDIPPGSYIYRVTLRDMIRNTEVKGEYKFQVQE